MGRNKVKRACAALSLSGPSQESICCSVKGIDHVLLQLIRSVVQIFHSCNNRTETVGTRLTDYSHAESNNRARSSPVAIDNLRIHHHLYIKQQQNHCSLLLKRCHPFTTFQLIVYDAVRGLMQWSYGFIPP